MAPRTKEEDALISILFLQELLTKVGHYRSKNTPVHFSTPSWSQMAPRTREEDALNSILFLQELLIKHQSRFWVEKTPNPRPEKGFLASPCSECLLANEGNSPLHVRYITRHVLYKVPQNRLPRCTATSILRAGRPRIVFPHELVCILQLCCRGRARARARGRWRWRGEARRGRGLAEEIEGSSESSVDEEGARNFARLSARFRPLRHKSKSVFP